ncbi:MAG: SPOR domain-containing protein, partial [Undibacterium sp.]|nr:SPOR domain-containing protein [Undibacterium sp.]MDO9191559.1 SPOR domain-containing protein [Undibacterium sp.]
MLRFFFWTLLLINALLLAFNFGYLGNWSFNTHEPQRMKMEQGADRLQLLSAKAAIVLNEPPAEKNDEIIACLEVGNFAQSDASNFEEKLKQLSLGDRQTKTSVADVATNMVYIPSLGSKEGADKKATELRRIGITDFFIVQDQSDMRWGISLGVFKTEEAAKSHLANLANKGVRSARIGPRTVSATKFSYQLRALNAEEKRRFDLIKADFPTQEARNCSSQAYSRS